MIARTVSDKTIQLASQYPVVTITGPRQSGKTTLAGSYFKTRHTFLWKILMNANMPYKRSTWLLESIPGWHPTR